MNAQKQPAATANKPGIARLYAAIIRAPIPKMDKLRLLAFARYANADGTSIYPGDQRVADDLREDRFSTMRGRMRLEDNRILIVVRRARWDRPEGWTKKRHL